MSIGLEVKKYNSMRKKVFLLLSLFLVAATVCLNIFFVLPGIKDPVSLLKFSRTWYVVFSFVLFALWSGVVALLVWLEVRLTKQKSRGTIVPISIINAVGLLWVLYSLILSAIGFSENVGTIRISSAEELSYIRNYPSGEYVLTKDIDLEGEEWKSISEFKGSLNGNGHSIINITVGENGFIKENLGKISSLTFSKVQYFNYVEEGLSKQRCLVCKWGKWHNSREAKILSKGEKERKCLICGAVERDGFLHPLSIIIMIVVALILIVLVIVMFINEKFFWMAVVIAIGIILGIFCCIIFFVATTPETTGESTQQSFYAYAGDPKPISIARAEASSVLSTESHTISIDDSYDGDLDTCWQDGVDGDGEGEILTYYFEHPCYVVGMDIVNGPVISENNYYENNRIRSMTLYYLRDGDVTVTVQLKDIKDVYSREAEYHTLAPEKKDEAYYCDAIKIVIDSVYKGSVYKDLCLTEIRFYERVYK